MFISHDESLSHDVSEEEERVSEGDRGVGGRVGLFERRVEGVETDLIKKC